MAGAQPSDREPRRFRPAGRTGRAISAAARASSIDIGPLLATRAALTASTKRGRTVDLGQFARSIGEPLEHRRLRVVVGEGHGLHERHHRPRRVRAARQAIGVEEALGVARRMRGEGRERREQRRFRARQRLHERRRNRRIRRWRRLRARRQKARDHELAVGVLAGRQVDRDLQPFAKAPARLARARRARPQAGRDRKPTNRCSPVRSRPGRRRSSSIAAAGDSASRLSTTTMSRSGAGPAAAGCPTLAPSAARNSRAAPDGAWLGFEKFRPGGPHRTSCLRRVGSPLRRAWRPRQLRPSARRLAD